MTVVVVACARQVIHDEHPKRRAENFYSELRYYWGILVRVTVCGRVIVRPCWREADL